MAEVAIRETLADLSRLAAALIRLEANRAVSLRGSFLLGLSGGATPAGTYRRLAAPGDPFPWEATEVFWCDERCVPPDHPESNYRLARETLLDQVTVSAAHLHRVEGEDPDPAAAAARYDRLLPPRFDLLLLGVGEDGHTASLFPGSPALRDHVHRAAAVTAPKPPSRRITVTPGVLEAAGTLLVLAAGEGKAEAVARALTGPADPLVCPAVLARRGLWLLDSAAAAGLGESAGFLHY